VLQGDVGTRASAKSGEELVVKAPSVHAGTAGPAGASPCSRASGAASLPVSRTGAGFCALPQQHAPSEQQQRWLEAPHRALVEHGAAEATMLNESASNSTVFIVAIMSQNPLAVKRALAQSAASCAQRSVL